MAKRAVQVTAEMIRSAQRRDSRRCMIAEAIQIAYPHYTNILVDLATIRWTNPRTKKRYVCLTPEDAGAALVLFDKGVEDIEPFQVWLDPIQITPTNKLVKKSPDQLTLTEQAAGRGYRRVKRQGPKRWIGGERGHVEGGKPLPTGHLPGTARAASRPSDHAALRVDPTDETQAGWTSNVAASARDQRVFGRRLLKH